MTTCYLATPIDFAGDEDHTYHIEMALTNYGGVTTFCPAKAWMNSRVNAKAVDSVNRSMIDEVDFVIARLPIGVPTVGVPMEIEYAYSIGKPIMVVVDLGYDSMMLRSKAQEYPERFCIAEDGPHLDQALEDFLQPFSDPWEPASADRLASLPPTATEDHSNAQPLGHLHVRFLGQRLKRSKDHDVGFDLVVREDTRIEPNGYADVNCGTWMEMPTSLFGWVVARSSTFNRSRLLVLPGVVDPGYRGEMKVLVWNTGSGPVTIMAGERLAQLLLLPNLADLVTWKRVVNITDTTDRGTDGFGSTGA